MCYRTSQTTRRTRAKARPLRVRRKLTTFSLLVSLAGMAPATATADTPAPDLETVRLMPGVQQSWIARRITLNGLPASMRSIFSAEDIDTVTRHFEQHWQNETGLVRRTRGEWQILATAQADRFISLHLRRSGTGTEGVLVVSARPDNATAQTGSRLPLPERLRVVSRQTHRDGDRHTETLTLLGEESPQYVKDELVNAFLADGWQPALDRPAKTLTDGQVLQFRRSREAVRIVIGRDARWGDLTLVLVVHQ